MGKQLMVALELGVHGKRAVAVALDWPGLDRGHRTGEAAMDRLFAYRLRDARWRS